MERAEDIYIIVFRSFNQGMLLYNKLLERKCKVELVSTPCKISQGCSQSIIFTAEYTKIIIEEIKKSNITINGVYRIIKNNGSKEYIHI